MQRILVQQAVYYGDAGGREFIDSAQRSNESRTNTHTALFQHLGIIAREAKKRQRPTEWWDGTSGFVDDRRGVGQWAEAVAYERMRRQEEMKREAS